MTLGAAMVVGRALTHYQRLQERNAELLREQVEELEAFAGRVAHDILGPLSTVSLSLQLLERREALHGEAALTRARSGVWSIDVVVRDLLDFALSGARPARSAPLEVASTTLKVLEDLQAEATAERVELRHDLAPVPPVMCAPGVLVSLVSNLVRNALKHMGDAPRRVVTVRAQERADRVRVEVEDTGPGIAPDVLKGLFQPYVRGRDPSRPGLGLGLATVRRLAAAHGGAVGGDTDRGRGSTFWFELPRAAG
jgi:signal transduction histidine kinase